jgi:hypothetical protein
LTHIYKYRSFNFGEMLELLVMWNQGLEGNEKSGELRVADWYT